MQEKLATKQWLLDSSQRIALAQDQLEEAISWFQKGLESSQEFLRQDNIARAEFGLARVYALRGSKSKALEMGLSAREQFARMGMEREVDAADALLRQLGNSEDQYG